MQGVRAAHAGTRNIERNGREKDAAKAVTSRAIQAASSFEDH
jgi:hypothetical protein